MGPAPFFAVRNSAGSYTVTFPPDFRMASVSATAAHGGGFVVVTVTGTRANGFDCAARIPNTNGAQDADILFTAVGMA